MDNNTDNIFQTAEWIREPSAIGKVNHYSIFRQEFILPETADLVQLRISAAGAYVCRINGNMANFGQFSDFPRYKTYYEHNVTPFCQSGRNVLEIAVYYSGNNFTSHTDGEPGMIAELILDHHTVLAATNTHWRCTGDTCYRSGKMETLTGSLNYVFDFDAQKSPVFLSHAESAPRDVDCRNLTLSPVPPLQISQFYAGKIIHQGNLFRAISDETEKEITIAEIFEKDQCSDQQTLSQSNGSYMVFDLGMEYAGILTLEIEAAPDTICDIAHSEYLNSQQHVIPRYRNRCFTDRYRTKGGRQIFCHYFRRIACRYLEIHVVGELASFRLHRLGIQETPPDLPIAPSFYCDDPFFIKAHDVSLATLRLCMHEKYENCPWREQSICEYDARNQMLFGYPLWGNYNRAKAMLDIYTQSIRKSGFAPAAAPSATDLVIPSFTFLWLTAIYEYVLYSGHIESIACYAPHIKSALNKILSHQQNGLYVPPSPEEEPHLWNYCEAPHLEFMPDPPNAFYNLYLHEALLAMAELFRIHKDQQTAQYYRETADELGRKAEACFYDPDSGLYADHITSTGQKETFHGHIQMLFLAQNLVTDPAKKKRLLHALQTEEVPFPAINTLPYLIRAFFRHGNTDERQYIHRKIKKIYSDMLDQGAQTWWETRDGYRYGGGAGSLCHGWSASPAYYESSFILGVMPLEPGYRKFSFKPYTGDLQQASGSIRTPYGMIRVKWYKEDGILNAHVEYPRNCIIAIENYGEESMQYTCTTY